MISRFGLIAAAALAAAAFPAAADERDACANSNIASIGIQNCTKLIDGGASTTQERAAALFFRGRHLQRSGRHEDAIRDFDDALALAPRAAPVLVSRGLSRHGMREYADAIHDYGLAISLDPDQAHAYYFRGNAFVAMEDYEDAVRDYDYAIKLNPQNGNAYARQAEAYCKLGEGPRSHASRLRAIELGAVNLGSLQQRLRRLDMLFSDPTGQLDSDTRMALQDWAMAGCP